MTDKEKIKAEIKRQIAELTPTKEKIGIVGGMAVKRHLESILSFIDSLQEEHKQCMYSKDNYTEEDRKVLCEGCEEKCEFNQVKESVILQHKEETCKENGDSLTQEPVSDDLEKAAVEAFKQIVDSDKNNFLEIFKAGAAWKNEQMMAKAVDGEVTYGKSLAIPSLGWVLDKEGLDYGDKVKLIIVKED